MNIEHIIKKIKEYEKNGVDVYIVVKNIKTKEEGVASLLQNNYIAVFEGKEDGSEDRCYSIEEFKNKYQIMRLENEYEEEI